ASTATEKRDQILPPSIHRQTKSRFSLILAFSSGTIIFNFIRTALSDPDMQVAARRPRTATGAPACYRPRGFSRDMIGFRHTDLRFSFLAEESGVRRCTLSNRRYNGM